MLLPLALRCPRPLPGTHQPSKRDGPVFGVTDFPTLATTHQSARSHPSEGTNSP